MRSRYLFLLLLLAGSALALPSFAHATTIPYWGPIVPTNNATCAGSWEGLIQLVNNLIAFALTVVMGIVAPIMFAYIGFSFIVSGGEPSARTKAKDMALNLVVGIVLAMAAYIIVYFLLTSLTTTGGVSAWTSQMFNSGAAPCLPVNTTALNQSAGANNNPSLTTGNYSNNCPGNLICGSAGTCITDSQLDPSTNGKAGDPCTATSDCGANLVCDNTNACDTVATNPDPLPTTCTASAIPLSASGQGPCDPQVVADSAAAAGYSITGAQAGALACIAQGESSCGQKNPPYNLNYSWNKATANGKASTAAGAFQVLLSSNSSCYDNSVCEEAAGATGPLNCKADFDSNGFPNSNNLPNLVQCEQAAGSYQCSAAAAACLLQHQSFGAAYKTDPLLASCENQYGVQ